MKKHHFQKFCPLCLVYSMFLHIFFFNHLSFRSWTFDVSPCGLQSSLALPSPGCSLYLLYFLQITSIPLVTCIIEHRGRNETLKADMRFQVWSFFSVIYYYNKTLLQSLEKLSWTVRDLQWPFKITTVPWCINAVSNIHKTHRHYSPWLVCEMWVLIRLMLLPDPVSHLIKLTFLLKTWVL